MPMLSLNNDFIGYNLFHRNTEFSCSDTEELYQKNLKIQPIDWYYRDHKISYVRNSNGHRCKDISDIDLDNYILTAGCSLAEGIGLELEKTYPYLLSQQMNCDYYNLGVGGTGVDVMIHNLTIWLSTYKKPKLLIIQWPRPERFFVFGRNPHSFNDINLITDSPKSVGPWTTNQHESTMLATGDYIHYFKTVEVLASIKLKSFKIPQINITPTPIEKSVPLYKDYITFHRTDLARDLTAPDIAHFGIISHQLLVESINKRLINT